MASVNAAPRSTCACAAAALLSDTRLGGSGRAISEASASLMTHPVKGMSVEEPHARLRSFKGLMSLHESTLDAEAESVDDSAELPADDVDLGERG